MRMTVFRSTGLAALMLLVASPASAADTSGARVAEEFARPALAALAGSGETLTGAIGALCAAPDAEKLEAARTAFGAVVDDWGRVSVLRFGPLATGNRFERLFFWPDPRGLGLKQIQQVLAARDENAATPEGLSQKSVAAQGLPALEFALFGTGAESLAATDDPYRCRYAAAAARNIANVVATVSEGWADGSDFAAAFASPAADTDPYRSAAEVDGEIVKAADTAFQYIRAAELLPPLGKAIGEANGRRAPLWRSGLSFRLMLAQIAGVRDLVAVAGYAGTGPAGTAEIVAALDAELETARAGLAGVATPPQDAFADDADRARIGAANLALDHAGHVVADRLAPALGLTMGFNALDGD